MSCSMAMLSRARPLLSLSSQRLAASRLFSSKHHETPDPFGLPDSAYNNIPSNIADKIGKNLHLKENHPLNLVKRRIEHYFHALHPDVHEAYRRKSTERFAISDTAAERMKQREEELIRLHGNNLPIFSEADQGSYQDIPGRSPSKFLIADNLHPKVTTQQNFDDLLVPKDHVSRRPSDTYYFDKEHCLRTHTSAHQTQLLRQGHHSFLVFADCYRRDEIDSRHYPVFHQVEGVRVFSAADYLSTTTGRPRAVADPAQFAEFVREDLKATLEGLVSHLFGNALSDFRWVEAYFPFTDPSMELEIQFKGQWLEVLGCGVINQQILRNCGHLKKDHCGWAFGIGLERLAMALYNIPDIRLFWSEDARFLSQFSAPGVATAAPGTFKFQPYSRYPGCYKDVSFWVPTANSGFADNDFYDLVRSYAGDLVESVEKIDEFVHPKTKETSFCYRITYRSMDRNLTNEEIDEIQFKIRGDLPSKLGVKLR